MRQYLIGLKCEKRKSNAIGIGPSTRQERVQEFLLKPARADVRTI